ncbi:MAG TPA: hypothetical protein VFQ05_00355 [Candidatus Eisenbacteria bacterium]|nr:hypothetical protein [Candidatus Eisenbacteria bacterium]
MMTSLTHLSDQTLVTHLKTLVAQDRSTTAALLAHIAEFDSRRLCLPAGYPSTFAYCLEELGFCEQAAFKRIRAARTGRRFPEIFAAVADGRLNLSAVVLLAARLTESTTADEADELIAAASRKSKAQVERLLAERFPQPDVPSRLRPVVPNPERLEASELSPGTVETFSEAPKVPHSAGEEPGSGPQVKPRTPPRLTAIAPKRFTLQVTLSQEAHDCLRHAQALLSHQVPNGDLERLEFDHIQEVARGGRATVLGIRLLCRAHNQFMAERTFGSEFMEKKRHCASRGAGALP